MISTLLISLQNNCSIQPKTVVAPTICAHLQAQAGEEMSWNTQLKPDSGCRITNEIARTAFFENCAWKKFLDSQNSSILITICLMVLGSTLRRIFRTKPLLCFHNRLNPFCKMIVKRAACWCPKCTKLFVVDSNLIRSSTFKIVLY